MVWGGDASKRKVSPSVVDLSGPVCLHAVPPRAADGFMNKMFITDPRNFVERFRAKGQRIGSFYFGHREGFEPGVFISSDHPHKEIHLRRSGSASIFGSTLRRH
jgi:hypothetical protein